MKKFHQPCFQFEQGSCSLSKLATTGVMSLPGMSLKNSSKNHALLFLQETSPRPEFTCSERILFWYGKYATTACTANFVILTQHFWEVSLCPQKWQWCSLTYPSSVLKGAALVMDLWIFRYYFLERVIS